MGGPGGARLSNAFGGEFERGLDIYGGGACAVESPCRRLVRVCLYVTKRGEYSIYRYATTL